MASFNCPSCKQSVSKKVDICPKCGIKFDEYYEQEYLRRKKQELQESSNTVRESKIPGVGNRQKDKEKVIPVTSNAEEKNNNTNNNSAGQTGETKIDLEKLRQLSQESQQNKQLDLEKKVLQYCDPKKIAQELIKQLETNAANAAKNGGHIASSDFEIWSNSYHAYGDGDFSCSEFGLFRSFDIDEKNELSIILFHLIEKNISDKNIKLEFEHSKGDYRNRIIASLSW
jgi:hypothetical protein